MITTASNPLTNEYENAASYFLELASEQRLKILHSLTVKPHGVTQLATKLDVTAQEVHRNLDRLSKSGFTKKAISEKYEITTQGKIMLSQMPLIKFLTKNKQFFEDHDLHTIPPKFTKRLGVLGSSEHIKGVTKVLERWTSLYKNANEYIYDVISESPPGIIRPLVSRIQKGVEYRHIISDDLLEPEDRQDTLQKIGYYKLVEKGQVQRKISKSIQTIIILNEKESGIIFPSLTNESDLKHMFYSKDPAFHEWCIDYFDFIWKKSKTMRMKPMKN